MGADIGMLVRVSGVEQPDSFHIVHLAMPAELYLSACI